MARKRTKEVKDHAPPQQTPRREFRPRSAQQAKIWRTYDDNDLIMLMGPADTAKSFSACYKAWCEIENGVKEKIVIFRPAVASDEDLGFDPGTHDEKLAPWLEPIFECFTKICGKNKPLKGIIEGRSLGRTRGMTFENCVIIVTEAQNATMAQLKMILTRMGQNCRVVLEGDDKQTDLPKNKSGAFLKAFQTLNILKGVACLKLEEEPINTPNCRHPLVREITRILSR